MPTYEYRCQTCSQSFAVQARMADPPPTQGPDCEQGHCQLQKCLSRVHGFVAGQHPPAPALARPEPPRESATHVCSKYCDLHK
jgi:putative FmdB family regulatory protein